MMDLLRESKLVSEVPSSCREWKSANEYTAAWHGERATAHRRDVASSAAPLSHLYFMLFISSIPNMTSLFRNAV
ncbi:unnamed protein product [Toxocara canis]|uniref:Uncharacterized protein n=1 Tax=Toxocara canis TaxID=6265 RepID=A0A183V395_TOXCA|nr:unnamed protein product [Toxocara canis]